MLLVCLYVAPVSVMILSTYDVENKCLYIKHVTRSVKHASVGGQFEAMDDELTGHIPYRESILYVRLHKGVSCV